MVFVKLYLQCSLQELSSKFHLPCMWQSLPVSDTHLHTQQKQWYPRNIPHCSLYSQNSSLRHSPPIRDCQDRASLEIEREREGERERECVSGRQRRLTAVKARIEIIQSIIWTGISTLSIDIHVATASGISSETSRSFNRTAQGMTRCKKRNVTVRSSCSVYV